MTMHLFTHVIRMIIAAIFLVAVLAATGLAHQPTFNWAIGPGGYGVATDTAGNVYRAGTFNGTVDFDPGPGVSNVYGGPGGSAVWVCKYTPAGALIWARSAYGAGGPTYAQPQGVAVDQAGNVYVAGRFSGMVDFDPGAGTFNLASFGIGGNGDIFVLKLNAAGSFVWVRRMGGANNDEALSIAVSGNFVYTTGRFTGTADFDPGPGVFNLAATGAYTDMFVSKLDASAGGFVWARKFSGPYTAQGWSIAGDASGGVYVAGGFGGPMVMDSFTLVSNGALDGFVAKINSAGMVVFAGVLGGAGSDQAYGIALDAAGDMIVAGDFEGTVDFDTGRGVFNLTAGVNTVAAFVVKLNPAGNFMWARRLGGPATARAVAVDAFGYIYTTGSFGSGGTSGGTVDFDPGSATFNLGYLAFCSAAYISRLSPNGVFDWAGKLGGGATGDTGLGIAVRQFCGGPTQVDVCGVNLQGGNLDPTGGTTVFAIAGLGAFTVQVTFPAITQGHLYVSSRQGVLRYNLTTGAFPYPFAPIPTGGLSLPMGLTFGPDCNLYVSSSSNNQALRYKKGNPGLPYNSAGNPGAVFVSSQSGGLVAPTGITFGEDGRLYVSSLGATSDVLRYLGATGAFDVNFTVNSSTISPRGITFGGPVGDLYVTSDHDIQRYDRTTGAPVGTGIFATDPGALTHYDLTFGPDGDLYVTAYQTNKVIRFNGTTGAPLPDFVTAGLGGLNKPIGLAFGPDGNLYVCSSGTNQVLRYNGATGAFMGVFASGGPLNMPSYLVFGR